MQEINLTVPAMNTKSLMEGKLSDFEDKVYLVAKVIPTSAGFDVKFASQDPVVWLSEQWRTKAGGSGPTVPQMQTGKLDGRSLVSAGVFLWGNDQLILLRRDQKAPSFAGALTEAAGRCGEMPSRTMIKELNEEILVAVDDAGKEKVLGLASRSFDAEAVRRIKETQVGTSKEILIVQAAPYPIEALQVNVTSIFLDDVLVETIEGYAWFDNDNNTLEIRQSFAVPDNFAIMSIIDGEPYGRDVQVMDGGSLSGEYLTPCLAWLHDRLMHKELETNAQLDSSNVHHE